MSKKKDTRREIALEAAIDKLERLSTEDLEAFEQGSYYYTDFDCLQAILERVEQVKGTVLSDGSGSSLEFKRIKGDDSYVFSFSFDKRKQFDTLHIYREVIEVVDQIRIL